MADFVTVGITRQYIMIMMDKTRGVRITEKGEVACGLSLCPSLIICRRCLSSSGPPVLYILLKNTYPYVPYTGEPLPFLI